ncbi:MAG: phosphoribosylformylglycinamidine synthase subunit PurL [Candidatus Peribacteraceae bacterium]|nr:phosphoribosylformylglycinamidine synthase subunit PurL [Candidatus Peribacteraceae bacterium]
MKKHIEPAFDFENSSQQAGAKFLADNRIALQLAEAKYFQKKIGRPLTLTELTILGIQGSEHCSYRSTRNHLKDLPTRGKNVIMGPGEDAGIVEIAKEKSGKKWGLVIGHESHNHPSQIVPYEGAATGVGGIVRDILCMGARVIGCLDVLRFGDFSKANNRWLAREVVSGIAGYGNPLGVPNLGGDIEFEASFDSNCLVNVVAIGVLREDDIIHSYAPKEALRKNYDIIIVGKPTDRSGFGGASFASGELKEEDAEANKGAVQEPNPFLERHLLAATYDLFSELKRRKLLNKVSFKDMGAGGNVCASVEQLDQHNFGAEINLEKIHVGEKNLPPQIIAAAETQERFCWICDPKITNLILKTYNEKWALPRVSNGAEARVVGKVRPGNYVLKFGGTKVIDAPAKVLTEGLLYKRKFKLRQKKIPAERFGLAKLDTEKILRKLLASENISSRKPIYEKYDKQVQGATYQDAGGGGSAIIRPLVNTAAPKALKKIGITIGVGGNASLGKFDPKLQAEHAVAEAIANVVALGAKPLALTDCLNFGNPEKPEQMGEFVAAIEGLRDAAKNFGTPFVSGNVSLYNENGRDSINPSALVSCVGKLENANDFVPQKFQAAGNLLVLVGARSKNLGGSEFEKVVNKQLGKAFELDVKKFAKEIKFILAAKKLTASNRDIHRGGAIVAAAESGFGTEFGFKLDGLSGAELFSENPGFLLEIAPKNLAKLEALAKKSGVKFKKVGRVSSEPRHDLEKIWSESFRKTWRK